MYLGIPFGKIIENCSEDIRRTCTQINFNNIMKVSGESELNGPTFFGTQISRLYFLCITIFIYIYI